LMASCLCCWLISLSVDRKCGASHLFHTALIRADLHCIPSTSMPTP
jgi:hypothetical protein